jgi:hypothetical protein
VVLVPKLTETTGPKLCAGEELSIAAGKALGTELQFENISA